MLRIICPELSCLQCHQAYILQEKNLRRVITAIMENWGPFFCQLDLLLIFSHKKKGGNYIRKIGLPRELNHPNLLTQA